MELTQVVLPVESVCLPCSLLLLCVYMAAVIVMTAAIEVGVLEVVVAVVVMLAVHCALCLLWQLCNCCSCCFILFAFI